MSRLCAACFLLKSKPQLAQHIPGNKTNSRHCMMSEESMESPQPARTDQATEGHSLMPEQGEEKGNEACDKHRKQQHSSKSPSSY